jgi:hypothetical protein
MYRTTTILVSFHFGNQLWQDVPFPAAVGAIEKFLDAEQGAFVTLVTQVNEDQWVASFWSEVLGAAKPPTEDDWSAVRQAIGRARNAYDSGRDRDAAHELGVCVQAFMVVHKKFWEYRAALTKGGERAITTMEITNMVLGAAFSAGVGVMGASVWAGAAASAGLTAAQTTAFNAMMVHIGAQQKFDIADIVLQTGAAFVSSLLSGKLCEKFATVMARRAILKMYNLPGVQQMSFEQIKQWAMRTGVALPLKLTSAREFLSGLFASFGADRLLGVVTDVAKANVGKLMKFEELLEKIADRVPIPAAPAAGAPGSAFHPEPGRL